MINNLSTLDREASSVLSRAENGHHIVQIYRSESYLAEAVAHYISEALTKKDTVVLIATAPHWKLFRERLEFHYGMDLTPFLEQKQLHVHDAQEILSRFMRNGEPNWDLFEEAAGSLIFQARAFRPWAKVSAYGEMVNLLWQQGNHMAAIKLEEFWNQLGAKHSFSLFCAYYLHSSEDEMDAQKLKEICRTHSHFIPSEVNPSTERALKKAIEQVLGQKTFLLHTLIEMLEKNNRNNACAIPDYLATLAWLEENMPQTTSEIKAYANQYLSH